MNITKKIETIEKLISDKKKELKTLRIKQTRKKSMITLLKPRKTSTLSFQIYS